MAAYADPGRHSVGLECTTRLRRAERVAACGPLEVLAAYATAPWVLRHEEAVREALASLGAVRTLLLAAPSAGSGAREEPPVPVEFCENGLRFAACAGGGKKTGAFLDQRPGRALARRFGAAAARAASSYRVLDVGPAPQPARPECDRVRE